MAARLFGFGHASCIFASISRPRHVFLYRSTRPYQSVKALPLGRFWGKTRRIEDAGTSFFFFVRARNKKQGSGDQHRSPEGKTAVSRPNGVLGPR